MSFSASAADERVLGVEFTDDALSVSLRDGRIITVPLSTAGQRDQSRFAMAKLRNPVLILEPQS